MRYMRIDPFRELGVTRPMANRVWRRSLSPYTRRAEYPPLDVLEDEESFLVLANLPGMSKEAIRISVLGRTLTIEGERSTEDSHRYVRRERGYGNFRRTVEFTMDVAGDAVEAKYRNGILSVAVPKAGSSKPKQIAVDVEE